ncbi:FMN-binding protein MioC [Vibrio algarum]|uniref:FMN-binding protein MioC n=1 Tax=Vibrio algarum TaxID=3020714 RepID=A0ABT4YM17_9VIBR|nr:FMN-binding protein MioC [Vibrio sp. KJ40-1]MDB1122591.1 FMN-binding protein MioC [Vibrio sp. KJ40-1]
MIHIITGSTLGTAEYVGDHLSDVLQENGLATTIHNTPDLKTIPNEGTWLIVTSTHGAGDYPENIQPFINSLLNTPPKMTDVKFAVIAIGDSSYDTFCAAGKHAFNLLEDIGAMAISECLIIDILDHQIPEEPAEEWLNTLISQM